MVLWDNAAREAEGESIGYPMWDTGRNFLYGYATRLNYNYSIHETEVTTTSEPVTEELNLAEYRRCIGTWSCGDNTIVINWDEAVINDQYVYANASHYLNDEYYPYADNNKAMGFRFDRAIADVAYTSFLVIPQEDGSFIMYADNWSGFSINGAATCVE